MLSNTKAGALEGEIMVWMSAPLLLHEPDALRRRKWAQSATGSPSRREQGNAPELSPPIPFIESVLYIKTQEEL